MYRATSNVTDQSGFSFRRCCQNRSWGLNVREPLRIKLSEEREAIAVANELVGVPGLDVRAEGDGWEVSLDDVGDNDLLVRMLDAVRNTLAGRPSGSALVLLDGREYRMQGE